MCPCLGGPVLRKQVVWSAARHLQVEGQILWGWIWKAQAPPPYTGAAWDPPPPPLVTTGWGYSAENALWIWWSFVVLMDKPAESIIKKPKVSTPPFRAKKRVKKQTRSLKKNHQLIKSADRRRCLTRCLRYSITFVAASWACGWLARTSGGSHFSRAVGLRPKDKTATPP